MSVHALQIAVLPQNILAVPFVFAQPPDCPFPSCVTIERGQKELDRLHRSEAQLRETLHREEALLEQRDELLRHKDLMSRESDHRLINGLQMVTSLLLLQSREAQSGGAAEQLRIAAGRVATIGSVHRRLHALDHIKTVELKRYLEDLCTDIMGMVSKEATGSRIIVEGVSKEVSTSIGIPLGYVVSELVTNSAKYADGKITVGLAVRLRGGFELSVADEGPGFPEGFDPKKSTGLGMKIVSSLVKQIGGEAHFGTNPSGRGARFTARFRLGGGQHNQTLATRPGGLESLPGSQL